MKRHSNARGKQLAPLSQRGLNHLPRNPQQRVPGEGGHKEPGKVLDAFNERQETRQLHPTKGWRNLSVKRSRAQAIIAQIQATGRFSTDAMRSFLVNGY
jgi:hypothetical protein